MLYVAGLVHVAATLFMTGLIWFVQLVHYPLFVHVDRRGYGRFQKAHELRTTRIVAPAMLLEAGAAIAMTVTGWSRLPSGLLVANLALLLVIWLSTALLQVPRHRMLASAYDRAAHHRLTSSNWVRTAAWSARAILALRILAEITLLAAR